MSTNQGEVIDFKTKKQIDSCVKAAMAALEHENTAIADTPNGRFQRLLKAYASLKPLLSFLASFAVLPQLWRTGLGVLIQMLDSLVAIAPDIIIRFKAGKDL